MPAHRNLARDAPWRVRAIVGPPKAKTGGVPPREKVSADWKDFVPRHPERKPWSASFGNFRERLQNFVARYAAVGADAGTVIVEREIAGTASVGREGFGTVKVGAKVSRNEMRGPGTTPRGRSRATIPL
jgi:hypothetical protein